MGVAKRNCQIFGKKIRGISITESGILAAAHLGGPGSVKRFLKSNGNRRSTDDFGTSISEYMQDFAGYDTSSVQPSQKLRRGITNSFYE